MLRRAHSSTAENCGRPTPVIIRVVHIAPGPTPTLTIDAPALIRSRVPSADTTLPAASGSPRSSEDTALIASSILTWWPCAVSTTSRSTPASASARAFAPTSPLMPTAAAIAQPAARVDGGRVDAGADRAGAGQHAGQRAVGFGHHRHVDRRVFEQVEDLARIGADRRGDEVGDRDVAHPGEAVHADAVGLGDQADRACPRRPPPRRRARACGSAPSRRTPSRRATSVTGVSTTRSRLLTKSTVCLTAVIGRSCGRTTMPPRRATVSAIRRPGHRGHVGHHDRDRGARAVRRRQVDVEPRRHVGPAGHDEDVVVGQVVRGVWPSRNLIADQSSFSRNCGEIAHQRHFAICPQARR